MTDTSRPRHVVSPALIDSMREADERSYAKEDMAPPQDDLWRSEDYDDEPRSNGNFGLDLFQQECKEAAEKRERESRAEAEKKERAG